MQVDTDRKVRLEAVLALIKATEDVLKAQLQAFSEMQVHSYSSAPGVPRRPVRLDRLKKSDSDLQDALKRQNAAIAVLLGDVPPAVGIMAADDRLKVYLCNDHVGHWVGTASVIVARNENEARQLLIKTLAKSGLDASDGKFTLQLLSVDRPVAIVMQDGDY